MVTHNIPLVLVIIHIENLVKINVSVLKIISLYVLTTGDTITMVNSFKKRTKVL